MKRPLVIKEIPLKNQILTPLEYFRRVNGFVKPIKGILRNSSGGGINQGVVINNTIRILSGHKFEFCHTISDDIIPYVDSETRVYIMVLIDNDIYRIYLLPMCVTESFRAIEINITGFITPELNKLDFLRKSSREDESCHKDLMELLVAKAKKEIDKIHPIEPQQHADLNKLNLNYSIPVQDVYRVHGKSVAMSYIFKLHKEIEYRILGVFYNNDITSHEKIRLLERIIKNVNIVRKWNKWLKSQYVG